MKNNWLKNLRIERKNNERLEIEIINQITRKRLKNFWAEKTEGLKEELRFLAVTNRSFRNLSNYVEEKKVIRITRDNIKEIEEFETETKRIKKMKKIQ